MLNEEAPVFNTDLNRGFRVWHIKEIYRPDQTVDDGVNNHVPNVDDAVIDWDVGMLRVTYVNLETGESRLEPWRIPTQTGVTDQDIILGAGPFHITEQYRVYVDMSVEPHPLSFDSRLHVFGTQTSHVKLFLGDDISEDTGDVISVRYDQNNQPVSDNIPLVEVNPPEENNQAIKQPTSAFAKYSLQDGELVTMVAYNQNGTISSVSRLLVKDTSFVKGADAATGHIVAISLESPFLSSTTPNRLEYPHNLPLDSMNLMGRVEYNDGRIKRIPLNGGAMQLYGIDTFVPSVVGQRIPLVLSYRLDETETTFSQDFNNGAISVPFDALTVDPDFRYNVKLYVVPEWTGDVGGYRLRYYLFSMERDLMVDVTQYVEADTTQSLVFQPTLYGTTQDIAVILELSDIGAQYRPFRHLQTFSITLLARAHSQDDPYRIDYNSDGEFVYGEGNFAVACRDADNPGNWLIDVTSGTASREDWLAQHYYAIDPLVIRDQEAMSPLPTHVRIRVDTREFYRPIAEWAESVSIDYDPDSTCVVTLSWVRETANENLELGITPMNLAIRP